MENQQQSQQNTSLCNGGCGFYGSPATDGLCSQCFKDSIKRQQDTTARSSSSGASPAAPLSSTSAAAASLSIATAMAEVVAAAQQAPTATAAAAAVTQVQPLEGVVSNETPVASLSESGSSASLNANVNSNAVGDASSTPPPKKPNRCHECKKRVGLTGFQCRCGGLYCADHRYDSAHNCSFDYKTMEREALASNNPKIVCEKIKRL